MYFPSLNNMKRAYRVDPFLIYDLDAWLGTRRKAVRKHLDPIQFSIDTGIDEELSISMFAYSTTKEIQVLEPRYVINCPYCDSILEFYSNWGDIPHVCYCGECDNNRTISEDDITIWFSIIKDPIINESNNPSRKKFDSGKGGGLSASKLDSIPKEPRGILQGLDERFDNLQ